MTIVSKRSARLAAVEDQFESIRVGEHRTTNASISEAMRRGEERLAAVLAASSVSCQKSAKDMGRTESSILELLEEDDGQTEAELIRHLGWSWPDPQSHPLLPTLEEMQRGGMLRCDGADRWWRRVTTSDTGGSG